MWAAVRAGVWLHVVPVIEVDQRLVDKNGVATAEDRFLAAAPPHVLALDCRCHPTFKDDIVVHEEVN